MAQTPEVPSSETRSVYPSCLACSKFETLCIEKVPVSIVGALSGHAWEVTLERCCCQSVPNTAAHRRPVHCVKSRHVCFFMEEATRPNGTEGQQCATSKARQDNCCTCCPPTVCALGVLTVATQAWLFPEDVALRGGGREEEETQMQLSPCGVRRGVAVTAG